MASEARIYYNKAMRRGAKRPKESLQHQLYPSLAVYYLCFWSAVGYADQDEEEWEPAGYAMQFHELVEEYVSLRVCATVWAKAGHTWCHLVSQHNAMLMIMAIWGAMTLTIVCISNYLILTLEGPTANSGHRNPTRNIPDFE